MLQNFQEIVEAPLAAHPHGAETRALTSPCPPQPHLVAVPWGAGHMRVPVCTACAHRCVHSPGSPHPPACVQIKESCLGVGRYTPQCMHAYSHPLCTCIHPLLYAYSPQHGMCSLNRYTHVRPTDTCPSLCAGRGHPPFCIPPRPQHSITEPWHPGTRRFRRSHTHSSLLSPVQPSPWGNCGTEGAGTDRCSPRSPSPPQAPTAMGGSLEQLQDVSVGRKKRCLCRCALRGCSVPELLCWCVMLQWAHLGAHIWVCMHTLGSDPAQAPVCATACLQGTACAYMSMPCCVCCPCMSRHRRLRGDEWCWGVPTHVQCCTPL